MCTPRWNRRQHLYLLIWYITILHLTKTEDTSNALNFVSTECVLQLQVINSFVVGDGVDPEILLCRCNCSEQTLLKSFSKDMQHFGYYCKDRAITQTGQCIEKVQGNISPENCPGGGFRSCLIDLKAKATYNLYILKSNKIFFRLVTTDNEFVDVDHDKKYFIYKNYTYSFTGVKCHTPNQQYFLYFKSTQDVNHEWIETFQYSENNIKSLKKQSFVISTELENRKNLQSVVKFRDKVCIDKDISTTLDFTSKLELVSKGETTWSNIITNYKIINNDSVQIFYHTKPDIEQLLGDIATNLIKENELSANSSITTFDVSTENSRSGLYSNHSTIQYEKGDTSTIIVIALITCVVYTFVMTTFKYCVRFIISKYKKKCVTEINLRSQENTLLISNSLQSLL